MQTIERFCQENGVNIGAYSLAKLRKRSFAVEIVKTLLELNAQEVVGAKGLAESIITLEAESEDNNRLFWNRFTEGFGVWFAKEKLGATILSIEHGSNKKFSPNRRRNRDSAKEDPSCDFLASLSCGDCFFEVKDFSVDQGRFYQAEGSDSIWGFPPMTIEAMRASLEKKTREVALEKGANYLIARPSVAFLDDPAVSIQDSIKMAVSLSPSDTDMEVSFPVPSWFKGIYLVKQCGHIFLSVKQRPKRLPHTPTSLDSPP